MVRTWVKEFISEVEQINIFYDNKFDELSTHFFDM